MENLYTPKKLISIETIAIFTLSFLVILAFHHSFFWGDEILTWYLKDKYNGNFIQTLIGLSEYKPRIIFNSLWSLISTYDAPRYIAAISVATAEGLVLVFILKAIRDSREISPKEATLIIVAFFTCRYSATFWFDYIAGSIETISFLFFLLGVIFLQKARDPKNFLLCIFFFCCACMSHERYIAAILAVTTYSFIAHHRTNYGWTFLVAIMPVGLYLLANQLMGASLTTGTAGEKISINPDTFYAFFTYTSNVLLQTNFGHDWLVGTLNWNSPNGKMVSIILGGLTLVVLIYLQAKNQIEITSLKKIGFYVAASLALIFTASLPGLLRQEARWMFPIYCMIIVCAALGLKDKGLRLFLITIIFGNLVYLLSGSLNGIYNIISSRTAALVATSLNTINHGKHGAIIGLPSASWVFAGNKLAGNMADNGKIFSIANNIHSFQIDPIDSTGQLSDKYDFVLIKTGQTIHHTPVFSVTNIDTARIILSPKIDLSTAQKDFLGSSKLWNNWTIDGLEIVNSELILTNGQDAFLDIPADSIDKKYLVYEAYSVDNTKNLMRLQVNWHDKDQRFIDASIEVVEVSSSMESFSKAFIAPPNAYRALIYATLHNENPGKVALKSVYRAESVPSTSGRE